jgi:hypothetical protein
MGKKPIYEPKKIYEKINSKIRYFGPLWRIKLALNLHFLPSLSQK